MNTKAQEKRISVGNIKRQRINYGTHFSDFALNEYSAIAFGADDLLDNAADIFEWPNDDWSLLQMNLGQY